MWITGSISTFRVVIGWNNRTNVAMWTVSRLHTTAITVTNEKQKHICIQARIGRATNLITSKHNRFKNVRKSCQGNRDNLCLMNGCHKLKDKEIYVEGAWSYVNSMALISRSHIWIDLRRHNKTACLCVNECKRKCISVQGW